MVEVWREGGRRKEGRKEGRTALIKSNNPHLAGDGECFNAMVGITRSKVISFFLSCHFSHPGLVGFGFFSRACSRNPSFGNILSSGFFTFAPTVPREAFRRVFFALFILSFCRSRVLWVLDFCRVHAPEAEFRHQLVLNLISLRVPRAYAHQRIHAQTMITFVFQVHSLTREPMPKP